MSVLPLAAALQIALSCATGVAPETLLSIVMTESGFETLAVNDNTQRRSFHPESREEAVALVARLTAAGHNLDLGIAQINQAAGHLARRGLSVSDAFDPCVSFKVGGEVLVDCYRRAPGTDEQERLRAAVGCYNTGRVDRGAAYIQRVQANAAQIVPALRVPGIPPPNLDVPEPLRAPTAPPSWDVWSYTEWRDARAAGAAAALPLQTASPPSRQALSVESRPVRGPMPSGPSEAAPVVLEASHAGASE